MWPENVKELFAGALLSGYWVLVSEDTLLRSVKALEALKPSEPDQISICEEGKTAQHTLEGCCTMDELSHTIILAKTK